MSNVKKGMFNLLRNLIKTTFS